MSVKKFIVDLSEKERQLCQEVVKKLKGTGQKVRRAKILLKADSGWSDTKIAKARLVIARRRHDRGKRMGASDSF